MSEQTATQNEEKQENEKPEDRLGSALKDLIASRLKECKEGEIAAKENNNILDKATPAVEALVKVCDENGIALAFAIGLDKNVITARKGLYGNRCLTLFLIKQLEHENIHG